MAKVEKKNGHQLRNKRKVAKLGMSLSLGVILTTALNRNRHLMRYHTLAGVALLGFTVWHMMLYNGNMEEKR